MNRTKLLLLAALVVLLSARTASGASLLERLAKGPGDLRRSGYSPRASAPSRS
jgi:hypothetical protein